MFHQLVNLQLSKRYFQLLVFPSLEEVVLPVNKHNGIHRSVTCFQNTPPYQNAPSFISTHSLLHTKTFLLHINTLPPSYQYFPSFISKHSLARHSLALKAMNTTVNKKVSKRGRNLEVNNNYEGEVIKNPKKFRPYKLYV